MPEGTEVKDMAGALALAVAEREQASSPEPEAAVPAVEVQPTDEGEQAPADSQGQPAAEDNGFSDQATELGDMLMDTAQDTQNSSDSGAPAPGSDEFLTQSITVNTVNGPQTVTIQELSDGYLRQADYTQKTQGIAAERKHLGQAEEFLQAFETDPHGFVRSLAVQAGYIEEGGNPIREVPMVAMPTQENIDSMVNNLVEERFTNDPRVQQMQIADAKVQLDAEFARLESKYEVPVSQEVRQSIVQEAFAKGSTDLEGILAGRLVLAQKKQSGASATNGAATSRPGTPPIGQLDEESSAPAKNLTMAEAWQKAKVDAANE